MSLPPIEPVHGYLPPGLHAADIEAMRTRFVTEATHPKHRNTLFDGYLRLIAAISMMQIQTEQWIGGSFVSTRHAPNDIDLVNFCEVDAMESLPRELTAMISQYFNGPETAKHCHCDSYYAPKAPANHPSRELFEILANYWQNRLGKDRDNQPKGIVTITIGVEQPQAEEADDDAAA